MLQATHFSRVKFTYTTEHQTQIFFEKMTFEAYKNVLKC